MNWKNSGDLKYKSFGLLVWLIQGTTVYTSLWHLSYMLLLLVSISNRSWKNHCWVALYPLFVFTKIFCFVRVYNLLVFANNLILSLYWTDFVFFNILFVELITIIIATLSYIFRFDKSLVFTYFITIFTILMMIVSVLSYIFSLFIPGL